MVSRGLLERRLFRKKVLRDDVQRQRTMSLGNINPKDVAAFAGLSYLFFCPILDKSFYSAMGKSTTDFDWSKDITPGGPGIGLPIFFSLVSSTALAAVSVQMLKGSGYL
jgi:hypothetical protein